MSNIDTAAKELAEKLSRPRQLRQEQRKPQAIFYRPLVTPYLPEDGKATARAHEKSGLPAFIKAYEKSINPLDCPNCQGMGFVLLTLASAGPYNSPLPHRVITWFDGDDRYRKGWYLIDRTLQFDCPECRKR